MQRHVQYIALLLHWCMQDITLKTVGQLWHGCQASFGDCSFLATSAMLLVDTQHCFFGHSSFVLTAVANAWKFTLVFVSFACYI